MKLEPIQLKSFNEGLVVTTDPNRGPRTFVASRAQKPEEPPPPPTFTEDDLRAAERNGFQKGFPEGVKEGRQQVESEQLQIDKQCAALTAQFEQAVMPIFSHYAQFAKMLHGEMSKVAFAIAKKVAGEALDENAHARIADIATRACETMMHEPKLTITAHESLGDKLEKMLQGVAARLPEHTEIIILRDPDMPKSDCRIDWKLGSMEHSVEELWHKLDKVIGNMTASNVLAGTQEIAKLQAEVLGTPPADTPEAIPQEAPTNNEPKE